MSRPSPLPAPVTAAAPVFARVMTISLLRRLLFWHRSNVLQHIAAGEELISKAAPARSESFVARLFRNKIQDLTRGRPDGLRQ